MEHAHSVLAFMHNAPTVLIRAHRVATKADSAPKALAQVCKAMLVAIVPVSSKVAISPVSKVAISPVSRAATSPVSRAAMASVSRAATVSVLREVMVSALREVMASSVVATVSMAAIVSALPITIPMLSIA